MNKFFRNRKSWIAISVGLAAILYLDISYVSLTNSNSKKLIHLESRLQQVSGADSITKILEDSIGSKQAPMATIGTGPNDYESANLHTEMLFNRCEEFGLKMISMPTESKDTIENHIVAHRRFSTTGTFKTILKFIHQIETMDELGKIHSVQLRKEEKRILKRKTTILICDITISRYIKRENV